MFLTLVSNVKAKQSALIAKINGRLQRERESNYTNFPECVLAVKFSGHWIYKKMSFLIRSSEILDAGVIEQQKVISLSPAVEDRSPNNVLSSRPVNFARHEVRRHRACCSCECRYQCLLPRKGNMCSPSTEFHVCMFWWLGWLMLDMIFYTCRSILMRIPRICICCPKNVQLYRDGSRHVNSENLATPSGSDTSYAFANIAYF